MGWLDRFQIRPRYTIMGCPRCAAPATLACLCYIYIWGSRFLTFLFFILFSVCCLFEWGDLTSSKSVQDIQLWAVHGVLCQQPSDLLRLFICDIVCDSLFDCEPLIYVIDVVGVFQIRPRYIWLWVVHGVLRHKNLTSLCVIYCQIVDASHFLFWWIYFILFQLYFDV